METSPIYFDIVMSLVGFVLIIFNKQMGIFMTEQFKLFTKGLGERQSMKTLRFMYWFYRVILYLTGLILSIGLIIVAYRKHIGYYN